MRPTKNLTFGIVDDPNGTIETQHDHTQTRSAIKLNLPKYIQSNFMREMKSELCVWGKNPFCFVFHSYNKRGWYSNSKSGKVKFNTVKKQRVTDEARIKRATTPQ